MAVGPIQLRPGCYQPRPSLEPMLRAAYRAGSLRSRLVHEGPPGRGAIRPSRARAAKSGSLPGPGAPSGPTIPFPARLSRFTALNGSLAGVYSGFGGLDGVFLAPKVGFYLKNGVSVTHKTLLVTNKAPVLVNKAPVLVNKGPVVVTKAPLVINAGLLLVTTGLLLATEDPLLITEEPLVVTVAAWWDYFQPPLTQTTFFTNLHNLKTENSRT